MFKRLLDNSRLLFALLLASMGILVGIVAIVVDYRLTCTPTPTTSTAFLDVYDQGMAYYSKGETREFFVIYQWRLEKAETCYELAIEKYNEAITIDPEHSMGYWARGSAYVMVGQYEQALSDFEHILEIEPRDQRVRWQIATVYEKSGEMDTAVTKYEEALQFMEQSAYWTTLHPDWLAERQSYLEDLKKREG